MATNRVTRKDLQFLVSRVNTKLNSAWQLDNNPIYGGYELFNQDDSDCFVLFGRVSPREMDSFLRGILYGYDRGSFHTISRS